MLISAFVGCKKRSLPAITTTDNASAATTEPGSASETPRTDADAVRDSNALEVEAEPAEKTGASETELNWLSYRLTQEPLRGMEETDRFQVKDPPSGSRYIVARLLRMEGELQTTDITEHATTFLLKDVEGNAYEPCLYSMCGGGNIRCYHRGLWHKGYAGGFLSAVRGAGERGSNGAAYLD